MRDPWPAPLALSDATKVITDILHLQTLPPHAHEILLSFILYTIFENFVSPILSAYLFPRHYCELPSHTKTSWNLHFTGFVNALVLCTGVFFVILFDDGRQGDTWEHRMWAYSGASGVVQAIATGYFMWDFMVCIIHFRTSGILDLLHGTVGVTVAFLGFRPFALYYGLTYLLFELSTPFLHIHWLLDKLDMTGSRAQWYNGVTLIVTFFCCRLLLGPYLTWVFFSDVWTAAKYGVYTTHVHFPHDNMNTIIEHNVPTWLALFFLTCNATLMMLNFVWFSKMIATVRKRFEEPKLRVNGSIHSSVTDDRSKKRR